MANAYIYNGSPEIACDYFLKALTLKEAYNKLFSNEIYIGLGNAYTLTGNDSLAIRYYQNAFLSYQLQKNKKWMSYSLLGLLNNYNRLNLLDSVEASLQKIEALELPADNALLQGHFYGYKSLLAAKKGELEPALAYFDTASQYLKAYQRTFDLVAFQVELAEVLEQQAAYPQALHYAKRGYAEAVGSGLKDQVRDAARVLARLYARKQDHGQAYAYLQTYVIYNDSINNAAAIRKMANMQAEYTIDKKQLELNVLEKQNTLRRITLVGASLLGLALLFISLLLFRFNRHRAKINRILKQNHQQILQQKQALEAANATKDKMFSIVSHDLRSPIHAVSGVAGFLKSKIENNEWESLRQLSALMLTQMKNISGLLDNLLDWSANQQGVIAYHPQTLAMKELVESQLALFHYAAENKHIRCENAIPEDCMAYADRNTMATVFRNIINNAIKFTPEGGLLRITGLPEEDYLLLSVRDNGVGMPADKVHTLFELSTQNSTYGTKKEKGVGLGLRLVYEFVQLNRGEVWVESEEGKGTVFFVKIPKEVN